MAGNPLKIKLEDLPENWKELYKQGYYPEDTQIVWKDDDWLNESLNECDNKKGDYNE